MSVLPDRVPVLEENPVRLRPWRDHDAGLVAAASTDPPIPLITTVPPVHVQRAAGSMTDGLGA